MKFPRRRFLQLAAGAAALPAVSRVAMSQAYPTRPITLVVPSAPGGSNDVAGRIVAEHMRASLGQPIVIENVAGANGTIATGRVARAAADGYTLIVGGLASHVLNGALYALSYDVLKDFEPVAVLASWPYMIVGKRAVPAKDLMELIAWLRANPNTASQGSPGALSRA